MNANPKKFKIETKWIQKKLQRSVLNDDNLLSKRKFLIETGCVYHFQNIFPQIEPEPFLVTVNKSILVIAILNFYLAINVI